MNISAPSILAAIAVAALAAVPLSANAADASTSADIARASISAIPPAALQVSAAKAVFAQAGIDPAAPLTREQRIIATGQGWAYVIPGKARDLRTEVMERRVLRALSGPRSGWPTPEWFPLSTLNDGEGGFGVQMTSMPAGSHGVRLTGWAFGLASAFPDMVVPAGLDSGYGADMAITGEHSGRLQLGMHRSALQVTGAIDGEPINLSQSPGDLPDGSPDLQASAWVPEKQFMNCVDLARAGYTGIRSSLLDTVLGLDFRGLYRLSPRAFARLGSRQLTRVATLPLIMGSRGSDVPIELASATARPPAGDIGVRAVKAGKSGVRVTLRWSPLASDVAPINWAFTIPLKHSSRYQLGKLRADPPLCAGPRGGPTDPIVRIFYRYMRANTAPPV